MDELEKFTLEKLTDEDLRNELKRRQDEQTRNQYDAAMKENAAFLMAIKKIMDVNPKILDLLMPHGRKSCNDEKLVNGEVSYGKYTNPPRCSRCALMLAIREWYLPADLKPEGLSFSMRSLPDHPDEGGK